MPTSEITIPIGPLTAQAMRSPVRRKTENASGPESLAPRIEVRANWLRSTRYSMKLRVRRKPEASLR
jgi:hypothetical protein